MRVLLVDDQRDVRVTMRRMLRRVKDLEILEASTRDAAIAALAEPVDLLLLDIRLSDDPRDRGGLEILREMRRPGRDLPAIIVSSSTAMDDLREAMRLGARDYVLKDELCEELLVPIVASFRERHALTGEVQRLRARVEQDWGVEALVGSSPAMDRVRRAIVRVADSDVPVLLLGETGTGKEMVAHAIHQTSGRRNEPFVAVNCAAIPASLLESTLFGHERGAFTGAERRRQGRMAAADGGTLLLDEIGDLPIEMQAKLLRVLEEGRFLPVGADAEVPLRARVIAATNADLAARVQAGTFRGDLFYRLDVVTVRLPSLAERGADFEELFVAFNEENPRKLRYTKAAIEWLAKRPWPGNVRELKNVVRRISIMSDDDVVDVSTLEQHVAGSGAPASRPVHRLEDLVDAVLALPETGASRIVELERQLLRRALEQVGGNKSAAARLLGMSRKALVRRWERVEQGLDAGDDDDAG